MRLDRGPLQPLLLDVAAAFQDDECNDCGQDQQQGHDPCSVCRFHCSGLPERATGAAYSTRRPPASTSYDVLHAYACAWMLVGICVSSPPCQYLIAKLVST